MDAARAQSANGAQGRLAHGERGMLALFGGTIFLSAALLFSVQPMFARMVLPTLGGSPSVWAVSMCFFQAVLLAGYCYAHLLNRHLGLRTALMVHVAVLAVATLALPIALPASAHEAPSGNTYVWLLGVLAAGVGLPFFAVSANAPLLQSWFARSGHPHAADPYFLYAASNVGSLLALVSYPLLLEPSLGLSAQAAHWTSGFMLLAVAILASGLAVAAVDGPATQDDKPGTAAAARDLAPAALWRERAVWVGLAFVPSAFLTAYSTMLSTDIASAPLLWVMPLALFLLTFVMVFREVPVISHEALLDRQAAIGALAIFGAGTVSAFNWKIAFATSLAAFLVTALVCHRELYLKRPAAGRLTEFYLWMSVGGVLGGIFSALLAPQIFTSIFEFPLLVAAGLVARPALIGAWGDAAQRRKAAYLIVAGVALLAVVALLINWGVMPGHTKLRSVIIAVLIGAMIWLRRLPVVETALIAVMVATLAILPEGSGASHAVRSFFGVHRVVWSDDGQLKLLMHGTTVHGAERKFDKAGRPVETAAPATYYYPGSPMARSLDLSRRPSQPAPRVGVVGLGTGSLACHGKPGETWRYFEIDKAVADLARDPTHFSFLPMCMPDANIVIGDARLTLAGEPSASFDHLVIDAFSSDAIPVHLITGEALRLYFDKLKPDGVLVFHVTNRHLDLEPVVAATAAQIPGVTTVLVNDRSPSPGFDSAPSKVVLMSRSADSLRPALAWPGAVPAGPVSVAAWTDDYSDLLSAMRRQMGW